MNQNDKERSRRCWGITLDIKRCQLPKSGLLFCHKHKRQPHKFIAGALVVILLGYLTNQIPGCKKVEPKPNPITLSANRIDLRNNAINKFLVRNISSEDLYNIVIKLQLKSPVLSITNGDISVKCSQIEQEAGIPIGNGSTQFFIADGSIVWPGLDFPNQEATFIVIPHLAPSKPAEYLIRNQSFKPLPPGEHCLLASVQFYTNTLPATHMFPDGGPSSTTLPSFQQMGIKGLVPGKIDLKSWLIIKRNEGADFITNTLALMQAGRWDEASKAANRNIELNPFLGDTYGIRCIIRMQQGKFEEAYDDAIKERRLLPESHAAYAHVAQCLLKLERWSESLASQARHPCGLEVVILLGLGRGGIQTSPPIVPPQFFPCPSSWRSRVWLPRRLRRLGKVRLSLFMHLIWLGGGKTVFFCHFPRF